MAVHRFWRLNCSSVGDVSIRLPTLEMRSVVGGANLAITGNGTASASSATYPADNAFDGSVGSVWITAGASPHWIQWDFGVGNEQEITQFTITNEPSGAGTYCMVSGNIAFSDDGSTWTPVTYISGHSTASGFSATYTYSPPRFITADLALPMLTLSAGTGATAELALPVLMLEAGFGAMADNLVLPALTVQADFGITAELTFPMLAMDAAGHDSTGENSFEGVLPALTLQANFGAAADSLALPMLAIDAAMTGVAMISVALTLPMLQLDAGGEGSAYIVTADLTIPMLALEAQFGMDAQLALPMMTLDASMTAGGVLTADVTIPMLTLDAQGTRQNFGSIIVTLPMLVPSISLTADLVLPMLQLDAGITAVVTATYEAYAINLKHAPGNQEPVDEVTHYTNFPFNGIVRYQSSYYGWGADGLYLLEGTMDDANEIQYVVRTCIDDFKLTNEKNVVSAYFAGRIGPDMTVTLYAGEDGQASYDYHTANGPQARTHREKFARGVTDRYFAIGVSGKGALELADIELEINKLKRKT